MITVTFDETKWKLVPIEPTPEMIEAAGESIYGHSRDKACEWAKEDKFESCSQVGSDVYRAMLSVAPSHSIAAQESDARERSDQLNQWIKETGAILKNSSWHGELEAIVLGKGERIAVQDKDGERYRFLRSGLNKIYITPGDLAGDGDCDPVPACICGVIADAAIDAAIAAQQGKSHD